MEGVREGGMIACLTTIIHELCCYSQQCSRLYVLARLSSSPSHGHRDIVPCIHDRLYRETVDESKVTI